MTRQWVIPGYRVGRICTEQEIRECFGFDFSRATWHLHGRPVAATVRLRHANAVDGPVRCRLHESQGQARFGELLMPAHQPSVDVPLRADALDEIWLSATENFGLDGVIECLDGSEVDCHNLQVSLLLETASSPDIAPAHVA